MTAEDAANISGATARAIGAYDKAQGRVREARAEVERARKAVEAAGDAARKAGSWPSLARSLDWPSSADVRAGIDALHEATEALQAAQQDLRQVGLHPERWGP